MDSPAVEGCRVTSGQRGRTWANIRKYLQGQADFSLQLQIYTSFVPQEIFGIWGFKSPHEDTPCGWLNSVGLGPWVGLCGHVL